MNIILSALLFLGSQASFASSFHTSAVTITYYCPYGHAECTDYNASPSYKCKHAAQADADVWKDMQQKEWAKVRAKKQLETKAAQRRQKKRVTRRK